MLRELSMQLVDFYLICQPVVTRGFEHCNKKWNKIPSYICLRWLFTFYKGKSPPSHPLTEICLVYFFPTIFTWQIDSAWNSCCLLNKDLLRAYYLGFLRQRGLQRCHLQSWSSHSHPTSFHLPENFTVEKRLWDSNPRNVVDPSWKKTDWYFSTHLDVSWSYCFT